MTDIHQAHFLLTGVAAVEPGVLRLSFADGHEALVDLSSTIRRLRSLSALKDWKTFQRVSLDEWSRGVVFDGDDRLSLASDNLRAMSLEQSGEYSHQHVIAWMERHAMTLDRAACELGLSRRMLAYYRSGEKAVPRTVGLAMLGWEHLRPSSAARSAPLTKGARTSGSHDLITR
jgi:Protein of unknown function (DUF2442).